MRTDTEIMAVIDDAIQSVWKNEIQADYINHWIMNEDGLKNALYFHLSKRLEPTLMEHDLRIFTEFKDAEFRKSPYRPDMVIAHVDMNSDAPTWRQAVTNAPIVIELKFKSNFSDKEAIRADYDKLKDYIETMNISGQLYMATIWACEDDRTTWIRKNAAWAKGRVTELNASFQWGDWKPQFYVFRHQ